jgi:hypothetical protein
LVTGFSPVFSSLEWEATLNSALTESKFKKNHLFMTTGTGGFRVSHDFLSAFTATAYESASMREKDPWEGCVPLNPLIISERSSE